MVKSLTQFSKFPRNVWLDVRKNGMKSVFEIAGSVSIQFIKRIFSDDSHFCGGFFLFLWTNSELEDNSSNVIFKIIYSFCGIERCLLCWTFVELQHFILQRMCEYIIKSHFAVSQIVCRGQKQMDILLSGTIWC